MSAHQDKVNAAIDAVKTRTMPGNVQLLALAAIGWGVAALLYGLFAFDVAWTGGASLVAVFYTLCMTQGAIIFAGILTGTQARWGRPLKRIAEGIGIGVLPAYLGLIVFLVLGTDIYPWSPTTIVGEPVALAPHAPGVPHAKEMWLQPGFFTIRGIAMVGVMILLDLVYLYSSLKPDLMLASKRLGSDAPAWWSRIIGTSTDYEAELEKCTTRMYTLVPIMGFAYAFIWSMASFDFIMSLDPWWFSNMFGGWIFMSSLWLGLATIAAVTMVSRDWLEVGAWIKPNVTHDLGKLMLAGCMFWAYTLFAQILPIYYTNVPEETNFLLVRMMLETWAPMARAVAVLCFLAPFTILLSRGIKKMRWPFFGIGALIMFGLFMERSLLVMPSVYLGEVFPRFEFLFINFGLVAGMLGVVTIVTGRFLASVPALPVSDEMLEDHPWDLHVHSLDHAHGHH